MLAAMFARMYAHGTDSQHPHKEDKMQPNPGIAEHEKDRLGRDNPGSISKKHFQARLCSVQGIKENKRNLAFIS